MSTWCPGHSLRGECEIGKNEKRREQKKKPPLTMHKIELLAQMQLALAGSALLTSDEQRKREDRESKMLSGNQNHSVSSTSNIICVPSEPSF